MSYAPNNVITNILPRMQDAKHRKQRDKAPFMRATSEDAVDNVATNSRTGTENGRVAQLFAKLLAPVIEVSGLVLPERDQGCKITLTSPGLYPAPCPLRHPFATPRAAHCRNSCPHSAAPLASPQ